ncbi:hypothetical protein [Prauserella muralis]|uniref:Secreted protein n=1 Tax=Prauserella muralis TaxID=588067 RepID=A0A2V4B7T3_9PSEU|nr:hypothetical protein [Prauserella muralis]PXY31308.1 hypothetical protein BAY60_02620 [Prauserella muralis]
MRALTAFALLLVAGCGASAGSGGEVACTEIGAPAGIGVDVAPREQGPQAEAATVEACWGGSCETVRTDLRPSTTAGPTSCTGEGPDAVCSAGVRETGGRNGFADIAGLPEQPVELTLTVTAADGTELARRTLTVTPAPVYPNGRGCPPQGPQAQLTVTADGEIRERA